jgi:ribonuclease HI
MSTMWLSLLSKRASSFAVVSRRSISVRQQHISSIAWQQPAPSPPWTRTTSRSRFFATKATNDDDDDDPDVPRERTPNLTRGVIRKLRVAGLREELAARGLDSSGTGKVMATRLLEAIYGAPPSDGSGKSGTRSSKPTMPTMTNDMNSDSATALEPATGVSTLIPSEIQLDPTKVYVLRFKGHTATSYSNAGVGIVLYDVDSQTEVWSGRKYFETFLSRFEAEYKGLSIGLKVALSKGVQKLILQGDNHVILKQVDGSFDVKKKELQLLYWTTVALKEQFLGYFEVQPINPAENAKALSLASRAVATKKSYNLEGQDGSLQTPEEKAADVEGEEGAQAATSDDTRDETAPHHIGTVAPINGAAADFVSPPVEMRQQDKPGKRAAAAVIGEAAATSKTYSESDNGVDPASVIDPRRRYLMRFDGGSRGNPGLAGAGMVIYDDNQKEVWCGWKFLDYSATNNDAEYTALIVGLKCALSLGITNLRVEGDSELIVRQLEGRYRVKEGRLQELWKESKELIPKFDFIEIRHIPRAKNKRADELANAAMDSRESFGFEDTTE